MGGYTLTFFVQKLLRHLQPNLCVIALSAWWTARTSAVFLNLVSKADGFRARMERIASLRACSWEGVLWHMRQRQLTPHITLAPKQTQYNLRHVDFLHVQPMIVTSSLRFDSICDGEVAPSLPSTALYAMASASTVRGALLLCDDGGGGG